MSLFYFILYEKKKNLFEKLSIAYRLSEKVLQRGNVY